MIISFVFSRSNIERIVITATEHLGDSLELQLVGSVHHRVLLQAVLLVVRGAGLLHRDHSTIYSILHSMALGLEIEISFFFLVKRETSGWQEPRLVDDL